MSSRSAPIDYVTLAEYLKALGYPARLELLDLLRFGHTMGEIKLSPHRVNPGENPGRTASRQTIQAHLDKLIDADLVRVDEIEQDGRAANRYRVNPQKLYALTEDLRRLSVRYAGRGIVGDATNTLGARTAVEGPAGTSGPRLVLVHGAYEGKVFSLDAASARDGQWVIGRKLGVQVALDYDPFVSLENSVVEASTDGFSITDLPESKNGTSVNWEPIPKGTPRRLRPSDVVGVGRSLLVFAPA